MYFLFVVLQGDLEEAHRDKDSKCVFLTVHDIGSNHSAWESLIGKYSQQLLVCSFNQCNQLFLQIFQRTRALKRSKNVPFLFT